MTKKYSTEDGYTISDLFHYGIDHLYSSGSLFELDAHCYDSAGYLSHLGVELILKGWHLHQFGYFENNHRLLNLYNKLKEDIEDFELEEESIKVLELLDSNYELRYPRKHDPVETGSEDWAKINAFVNTLWENMPEELLNELEKMDATRKGGRVLMRKKVDA